MTLMLAGASYAADKIALICADANGKDDYSLSIDLDRKLASFHISDLPDVDGIPVTRVMALMLFLAIRGSRQVRVGIKCSCCRASISKAEKPIGSRRLSIELSKVTFARLLQFESCRDRRRSA